MFPSSLTGKIFHILRLKTTDEFSKPDILKYSFNFMGAKMSLNARVKVKYTLFGTLRGRDVDFLEKSSHSDLPKLRNV